MGFEVKDSGVREQYKSGMVRDTAQGKFRPDLVRDGPMLLRWMQHLTKGARKYAARNWMKAEGQEEFDRFMESTERHYITWYMWRRYQINIEDPENPVLTPPTEDHAAGVFFGINGVEYVQEKLDGRRRPDNTGLLDGSGAALQALSEVLDREAASRQDGDERGLSLTD